MAAIHAPARVGVAASTPVKKKTAGRRWHVLPPPIECAGHSLRGREHEESGRPNEDAHRTRVPHFFGVADGVGGGGHGEVASHVLLDYCGGLGVGGLRRRDIPGALTAWVRSADRAVARRLADIDDRPGAATFVGLWMRGDRGWLVHVGDARAYLFRPGEGGRALTIDQTYGTLGEAVPEGGSPDDPARMVGCGAVGHPPATPVALRPGDTVLLCTDGFHRHLPPECAALLGAGLPLRDTAAILAKLAHAEGSRDDITVLLVRRNRRFRPGAVLSVLAFAAALAASLACGATAAAGLSAKGPSDLLILGSALIVMGGFVLGGWIGRLFCQAILWIKGNG